MSNLNELSASIFEANKAKGFHDKPQELGTYLMLMVSELGEALEAHRKGRTPGNLPDFEKASWVSHSEIGDLFKIDFELYIKDTVEDELADALIRILDYCGLMKIDIDSHVKYKRMYNSLRIHKHGKNY